jgi:hypothetical protein
MLFRSLLVASSVCTRNFTQLDSLRARQLSLELHAAAGSDDRAFARSHYRRGQERRGWRPTHSRSPNPASARFGVLKCPWAQRAHHAWGAPCHEVFAKTLLSSVGDQFLARIYTDAVSFVAVRILSLCAQIYMAGVPLPRLSEDTARKHVKQSSVCVPRWSLISPQ